MQQNSQDGIIENNQETGVDIDGSTNPELLAGGEVSAVGGSRNIKRTYGANTEIIRVSLENAQQSTGISSEDVAAGESGWLSARNFPFARTMGSGLDKNFLGSIQGIVLNDTDSIGRIINPELQGKLSPTVFKTEDGTVISFFHWSPNSFNEFKFGDGAFHLGTLTSAITVKNRDKNHKGKENVSVTFAAPVVLNEQIGNVAVCVMYGKGQVHSLRVLTPEGKTFELLKIEDTESTITGHSAKAMAEPYIDSVSNNSIYNPNKDVKQKEVFGFKVNENADVNEDLLEELRIYHPEAEVDNEGNITVYHRTSKENADKIRKSGIMTAKEDALYFSSKESGYNQIL